MLILFSKIKANKDYIYCCIIKFTQSINLIIISEMTTLIAEGVCCCFACCCKDISQAMKRMLGPQKVTKIFYLVLVVAITVPAIAIMFYLNQWGSFRSYFSWLSCPASSGGGFECIGPSAIYRISLSFFCLFFLMMIVMLCRNRFSMVVNEGLFCVKYVLVLGTFIAFLFVKGQTFQQYSVASKYISIIFMIIQSIILIDLFYLAGIKLVSKYDQGTTGCAVVLITLTIFCESAAIALNVLGYIYFGSADACGNSLWANIVNSIVLILLPVCQIFNFNKQNSLLTTSMVSMYVSYLAFICQFSFGGGACVGRMTTPSLAADIIVSTFFFILTTYGTIMGGSGQVKITATIDLNQAVGGAQAKKSTEGDEETQKVTVAVPLQNPSLDPDAANVVRYQNWNWPKWHFYMCLASIYVGMLITNWTSASITTNELISNDFGFWVRITLSWATALLYLWTLIAPKICPERDFVVV